MIKVNIINDKDEEGIINKGNIIGCKNEEYFLKNDYYEEEIDGEENEKC